MACTLVQVPKHGDGRGVCESTGSMASGYNMYIYGGLAISVLLAGVLYICFMDKRYVSASCTAHGRLFVLTPSTDCAFLLFQHE